MDETPMTQSTMMLPFPAGYTPARGSSYVIPYLYHDLVTDA